MSLTNTTTKVTYVGAGTTSVFSVPFPFMLDTDLVVIEVTNDVETTLVLNTDYTVTGAQVSTGGSITLLGGNLAIGTDLLIMRVEPLTQLAEIRNQNQYYASIHETVFDKLTMISQQLQAEIDRAFKIPATQSTSTLPTTYPDANTALIFDGTNYVWDVFAGGGDVVGPTSSTDNAVVLFSGTTGSLIKNSSVLIDGSSNVSGIAALAMAGALSGVTTLSMSGALSGLTSITMNGALSGVTNLTMNGILNIGTPTLFSQVSISRCDLSATTQNGLVVEMQATNAATVGLVGVRGRVNSAASSHTVPYRAQFQSDNITKGAGSTITRDIAYFISTPNQGTTGNASIADNVAFSGSFFINQSGTDASSFGGAITAPRFIVSGSTIPANGIYLPSANTLGFAANSTLYGSISSAGKWTIGASGGTQEHEVNGNFNILADGILKLQDTSGGEYVGFVVPGAVTTYVLTLPGSTPTTNQILRAGSGSATTLVWTDGLATDTTNGFVNYYKTESISAVSGSFTGGTLKITRVGNVVTIASSAALTFSSSSAVSSASGLIPSYARPVADINQFTFMNGTRVESVGVSTAGLLDWRAFDWAGSGSSRTSALTFCLSYSV